MKVNKRGMIIRKEDILTLDETLDHADALKKIISANYPEYSDYVDMVTVFNGPVMITNSDDAVVLNTYDSTYLIYLPEDINTLTNYQKKILSTVLSNKPKESRIEIQSFPHMNNLDKEIVTYSVENLKDIISNNQKHL